ncbi:AsmA family protein [Marinimicrobium sp. ABcell2]|uniref:AsmA family protein n=1 Tax=Marinimicrobium sp. ABcell2 TaxID=3069751 RepID=UPI0027B7752E|nr:AsmA family protein [Marinimicrobium sp. ABcell2]MDQ2076085.1 AsmA family protein [Marinimicrobium sp. ABcell2]
MRTVRILFKVFVALVLLLVAAAVALVFLFDPNMFRPHLESAARDQGVELRIEGNLGWQLWPALGVEVNGIHVAALDAPDEAIALVDRASLRLAIRPLFAGNLEVHHLVVQGAVLDLRVDEQGTGNWEALLPDEPEAEPVDERRDEPTEVTTEPGEGLQLAVERISLRDSALRYQDQSTGQSIDLSGLNLEISAFNLQGNPFDLDMSWRIAIEDQELFGTEPMDVEGTLRSRFQLAQDMNEFRLSDGRLTLDLHRGGSSGQIGLTFSLNAHELLSAPTYQGELRLASFNPRAMMAVLDLPELDMASPQALTGVALNVRFAGDTEQLVLSPLSIRLDDTRIEGSVAVTDFSRAALEVALKGDQINIDDYLPPPTEEEEVAEPEATGDEELIPLDVIRDLVADIRVEFQQLRIVDMTFTDLDLRLLAEDGLVQLTSQLQAYRGSVNLTAELDGSGETAVMEFNSVLEGFQLAPFLSDMELDENLQLSGALNASASGTTRGVTMNQIMDALVAQADFSGAQVRMSPLNVEEQFCRLVNLANRRDAVERDWPDYTEMRPLAGRATMAEQVLKLESFEAGVSELTLGLVGQLNLKAESYDFTLPMRLGGERTSDQGCRVQSNYWIDRSLSLLRCRGSLVEVNPLRDCGFDSAGVQGLISEFATFQLQERYGERLEEEKARARQRADEEQARAEKKLEEEKARAEQRLEEEKRELEERAREKLGGDDEKKVEERLRGLLRR